MKLKMNISRLLLILFVCVIGVGSYFFYQDQVKLRNYRNGEQRIVFKRMLESKCISAYFNRKPEIKDLKFWGSSFPTIDFIESVVNEQKLSPQQVYILDLTYTKMPYIGNHPLAWYGYKDFEEFKNPPVIKSFSKRMAMKIKEMYYEWKTGKKLADIQESDFTPEKELIEKKGYHYLEPLPTEWRNDWSFVDKLIPIFESLPDDAWIYFHCAHGRGRTTTVMIIYDIFKTSKNVPLDDILERQYCIGGEDVRDTKVWANGTWDENELRSREKIIYSFYDYMHDSNGYGKKTFIQWLKDKKINV